MVTLPEIGLGCANLFKASLPEFIDLAARHGFRRISARPYAFAEALRQGSTEQDLRRQLRDSGIAVTMIDGLSDGLPGVPPAAALDPEVRALMPPDVLDPPDEACCLRTAKALGSKMLNVAAYRGVVVPVEEMAQALRGLSRRAAAQGVGIAIEFIPESGIPDIHRARQVWEACAEPNCGLMVDMFHLCRSGGTVEDLRRLPPGAIAGVQISDRDPGPYVHVPMGGRLLPGDGGLPLVELVTAALENNLGAIVDLEVLNADLNALSLDEATRRLAAAAKSWREVFESLKPH